MKTFRAVWMIVLLAAVLQAQPAPQGPPAPAHRPRVALALSGGGSLGIAHIGVLQYFEEHHIPVDAIAGTSIGGIVGGMYATGHSTAEMEEIFQDTVWEDYLRGQPRYQDLPIAARQDRVQYPGGYVLRLGKGLTLPAGLSTAEPLDLFLSRLVLDYSMVEDFAQLPTPFRCVATRLETGEAFVLRRGNLARALRATMAVPGIFTPVAWEGHVLVDGGLVDNLPTDVARAMDADVVVAVHFSTPLPPPRQLQSLPNVLTQAVSVAVSMTERENLRNADLVLAPSLTGIGGIDYKHARELIERGYQAAAQKERFLATLALNDADWAAYQAARRSRIRPHAPQPGRLHATSSDPALARYAQTELDRADGQLTPDHVEHELSVLAANLALPATFYRLPPEAMAPAEAGTAPQHAQSQTIQAEVDAPSSSQLFIRPSLALAVANGEPTRGALRGSATWLPQSDYGARYRVQFSIGYSPQIAAEYERPMGATQWFWTPSVNLLRQNSATTINDQHLTHWQDTYSAAIDLGYGTGPRWRLRGGVEAGYEHLSRIAFPGALVAGDGAFVAPRLLADWNSLDDASLPTRGELFSGKITARYRRSDGRTVPLGQARFEQHTQLFAGTLTASVSAASSFGVALNYFDLFPLGGPTDQHAYLYQQFRATSYAMGELAYRKPLRDLKLFGQRPQFGTWYDAAGLVQPSQRWQSPQSGSVGVLFNSPLGVITFAVGRTSDGQTRGWISVGRP
jgi:NTE family protein